MLDLLLQPEVWLSLATLTLLEIVLGIDNIIFLSIVAARLPQHRQAFARRLGLGLALFGRLALLGSIAWIVGLTAPVITLFEEDYSWRDLVLCGGGRLSVDALVAARAGTGRRTAVHDPLAWGLGALVLGLPAALLVPTFGLTLVAAGLVLLALDRLLLA